MNASLLQYTIIMHIIIEAFNYLISTLNLSRVYAVLTELEYLSLFKTTTMSIASGFVFVCFFVFSFPCSPESDHFKRLCVTCV